MKSVKFLREYIDLKSQKVPQCDMSLSEWKETFGISTTSLGKLLEVSPTYIRMLVNGTGNASGKLLARLYMLTGGRVKTFFETKGQANEQNNGQSGKI